MAGKLDKTMVVRFYKKLLALYPKAFREQLGESMEETFDDLCNERRLHAASIFIDTALCVVKEHALQLKRGSSMKDMTVNPITAAMAGILLCLPFTILFSMAMLNVNPFQGVQPQGQGPGSIEWIILGLLFLFPIALVISLLPVVQNWRAGNAITGFLFNLVVGGIILVAIVWIAGGIIADQYPCWIGVPNCD